MIQSSLASVALLGPQLASARVLPYTTLGNPFWDLAGAAPSLDLRFTENKSLVDAVTGQNLVTFTRSSDGTYIDSDGVLRTAAAGVPRFDHNPLTGECLGLLVEEQRVNLLLNNATLSTQNVTVAATAYTLSFYGTGTVTLSGTSTAGPLVGTGANQRVTLTFTPTAGTLTLTVSGSVTNANLEAGSFATSWIPTTNATATRSADVASITGAAFSSWYRQDEGTVFVSWSALTFTATARPLTFNDGTAQNAIGLVATASAIGQNIYTANSFQGTAGIPGSYLVNAIYRQAATYRLNDSQDAVNGAVNAIDTSCSIPSVTQLLIGQGRAGVATMMPNGTISRLTYWPRRLPNSTLQAITL